MYQCLGDPQHRRVDLLRETYEGGVVEDSPVQRVAKGV